MFKATINNISVKRRYWNCQFYWNMVLWYPDKITDLTLITDNFIIKCCIEYTSPWIGIKLTTLMVIVTSCTDKYIFSYHAISDMIATKNKM